MLQAKRQTDIKVLFVFFCVCLQLYSPRATGVVPIICLPLSSQREAVMRVRSLDATRTP
jgi:hypothetical protein